MPSHAVKSGKRYRYYVSARLITGSRVGSPDGIRFPAAEMESGVIERIRQFLTNGAAVFEALQSMELDVGHVQQLMRRAEEIADTLANGGRSDLAAMLRRLVSRIEVRSHQISIAIQPAGLLTLLRGLSAVAAPASTDLATETAAPLVLTVPLLRRRSGRDTRLLIDGSEATQADPCPRPDAGSRARAEDQAVAERRGQPERDVSLGGDQPIVPDPPCATGVSGT